MPRYVSNTLSHSKSARCFQRRASSKRGDLGELYQSVRNPVNTDLYAAMPHRPTFPLACSVPYLCCRGSGTLKHLPWRTRLAVASCYAFEDAGKHEAAAKCAAHAMEKVGRCWPQVFVGGSDAGRQPNSEQRVLRREREGHPPGTRTLLDISSGPG